MLVTISAGNTGNILGQYKNDPLLELRVFPMIADRRNIAVLQCNETELRSNLVVNILQRYGENSNFYLELEITKNLGTFPLPLTIKNLSITGNMNLIHQVLNNIETKNLKLIFDSKYDCKETDLGLSNMRKIKALSLFMSFECPIQSQFTYWKKYELVKEFVLWRVRTSDITIRTNFSTFLLTIHKHITRVTIYPQTQNFTLLTENHMGWKPNIVIKTAHKTIATEKRGEYHDCFSLVAKKAIPTRTEFSQTF